MSISLQIFSEHGEVVGKHEHRPAVDPAVAGNHAVAGDALLVHAEVPVAMNHQRVELLEGAGIQEDVDTLPGGELARRMLFIDSGFATALAAVFGSLPQLFQSFRFHGALRISSFSSRP
jgi:hypothetical protein